MSLYHNKKQKRLFHLLAPQKADSEDCDPIEGLFSDFICKNSYILAQPSQEFNCIEWAIGVKKFIDPIVEINPHYTYKNQIGAVSYTLRGKTETVPLHQYEPDTIACKSAVIEFFDKFKKDSVISNSNLYVAADAVSETPEDDTIAFYFKKGDDSVESGNLERKGFMHASRYLKDIDGWVSDLWSSKLGQYKLMTHKQFELSARVWGDTVLFGARL